MATFSLTNSSPPSAGGGRPGLLVQLGRAVRVEREPAHLGEPALELVVLGGGEAVLVEADRERDLQQPVLRDAVVLRARAEGMAPLRRDDLRGLVERRPGRGVDHRVRGPDVVEALERDHRAGGGAAEVTVDDQAEPPHRAEVPVELELEQLDVAAAGGIG